MFGDLVAQLRADLTQYEKDLNRAEQMYKAHLQRLRQQSLGGGFGGSGRGGGGSGRGGDPMGFSHIGSQGSVNHHERAAEAAERRFRRLMASAEADMRRFYSQWDSAIRNNTQKDVDAEQKRIRASKESMDARMADIKQQIAFKKELSADDERIKKEEIKRSHESSQARLNDLKQIQVFRKHLADEEMRESRTTNQARMNDLKQRQVFEKFLAGERIKDAKQLADMRNRAQADATRSFRHQASMRTGFGGAETSGGGLFITPNSLRGLDQANAKWLKQQQEIAKAGTFADKLGKRLDEMGKGSLKRLGEGFTNMVNTLKFLTIGGAAGIFTGFIAAGIQMNRQFMQQRMTMATILGISDKIVDGRGKEVDSATALNLNLKEAEKLYGRIRKEAAGSILTGQELFTSVSANFGLGRRAGLSSDQIIQVTKLITQLAKTQGIEGEGMLAQETRALFTGEGLESATVARMLGINKKSQIQGAQDSGKFFEFIENKLKHGLPAIEAYSKSFDAFRTTLLTAFQDLTRISFEKVFEKITVRLGKFTEMITQAKVEAWADRISDALVGAYDAIEKFAKSEGWKTIQDVMRFLVDNAKTLLLVFGAMKGMGVLAGAGAGLRAMTAPTALLGGTGTGAMLGGLGTALSTVVVPAVAGIIIGMFTVLAAKFAAFQFGGGKQNEANASRALAESRMRTPEGLRLAAAKGAVREAEIAHGKATAGIGGIDPSITGAELERARGNLASTEKSILEPRQQATFADKIAKQLGIKGGGAKLLAGMRERDFDDGLRRESRRKGEVDLERRKKLNEERIDFAQHMAKLSDDKIRQARADAEAEKLQLEKNFKDTAMSAERRAALIKAIDAKLVRDVQIIREEEALEVAKRYATMTGNSRKMLDLEYRDTLLNIKKMHVAKEDEVQLRLAAEFEYQTKLRDFRSQEKLDRQQFVAEVTDNEVLQIINAANRAYKDRKNVLEKTVQDETQRNKEIAAMRQMVFAQADRKVIEKRNELFRKALDLNKESQEFENKTHKARLQMEKEVLDAQKRLAKETRDLMRERIQAEKELKRAQEDRLKKMREIGTGADMVGGMVRMGGPRGVVINPLNRAAEAGLGLRGVDQALSGEAEKLFASEELQSQLTDKFRKQTGNEQLAQAMAAQQVRELSGMAGQAGGTQNILGKLGELGIKTGGRFQESLQQIEGRGIEVANTRAGIERQTGMTELERERQDINNSIEEAQRRMADLDERQAEVLQSYKDTIVNLHDQFDLQVKETASSLANLAQQANEVANAFHANKMPIPASTVGVIRDTAKFNPQRAQTEAEARLSETGSFVFNEGAIKIDAAGMDPQTLLDAITKAAQDLSRRTAPSRR